MADRQTRITEIARAALARDAAMRDAFLREACRDDRSLRLEVDEAISRSGSAFSTELETVSLASPANATPRTSDIGHVENLLTAAGKAAQYRVLSRLGAGGMGAVYKGFDTNLNRSVAIKALLDPPSALDRSAGRLRKEALAAALLDHPYICKVYDLIDTAQGQLIVMEFIEGETLSRRLRSGRPSIETTLQWGIEIAEGLAEAHDRGLVHRDLTPRNVMVTTHGHIKLLDFGLALPDPSSAPTAGSETVTRSAERGAGTPAYMAPEQADGRPVTVRADVFALGVLLCECLTGTLPFGRGPWEDYIRRLQTAAVPIRQVAPHTPVDLARLVDRCLDRVPANRPKSAHEVVVELRRIAATLAPPNLRARWMSRATWLLAAGAALVAALVMWQFSSRGGTAPAWHSRPLVTSSAEEKRSRISPDGQWVSYLSIVGGETQLFVKRVDGGDATRVSVPDGTISDQMWSPDGTELVYVLRQGGSVSLQVVRAFFGGIPSLTIPILPAPRAGEVRLVRWIGGAIYIERVDRETSTPSLQRVDFQTATFANLTESWKIPGTPRGFDITPDGERVVFTASSAGQEDLWEARLDGTSVRRLSNDGAFERDPSWIDRGTTLIYQSNRGGTVDLWGLSANGGQPWPITSSPGIEEAESASSDGARLTFVQVQDDSHLWIWDPSTGRAVQLTDDALGDFGPAATANARAVVFQRTRPSPSPSAIDSVLYLGSVSDGVSKLQGDPRAIGDGYAARVSPDGNWVAYLLGPASRTVLVLKHLATDQTIQLSSLVRRPVYSLFPIGWAEHNIAWSPTSRALYFVEQAPQPILRQYQVGSKEPDAPLAVGQSGERYRDLHPSADDRFLAFFTSSTGGSTLSVTDLESHTSRVIGHFPVSAYLRGWTADGTAVVIVQPAIFHEDTTADVVVRVVPLGRTAIREAHIDRAFIATTRFDPARGLVYVTRSDAGVQNVYAYGLATSNLKQVTDNVRSDVAFSSVEVLADGRILGVKAEHKSDIWIAERDR